MARGIERLPFAEKLVRERRQQPVRADAAGAVKEQDAVDDLAGGVALGGAERRVVKLELGQRLAAREAEILD